MAFVLRNWIIVAKFDQVDYLMKNLMAFKVCILAENIKQFIHAFPNQFPLHSRIFVKLILFLIPICIYGKTTKQVALT